MIDAPLPQPVNWKTVGATLITVGGAVGVMATFVWWFISISPPVKEIQERLTELDHPRRGRVVENADRIKGLEQRWSTTVVRN